MTSLRAITSDRSSRRIPNRKFCAKSGSIARICTSSRLESFGPKGILLSDVRYANWQPLDNRRSTDTNILALFASIGRMTNTGSTSP